jgi:SAM-dependent methyltransferase
VPEPLDDALARIRELLLDPVRRVRAVAGGRRRGGAPAWVRAELRPVRLKTGAHVQVSTSDGSRPLVRNLTPGPALESTVDKLLAEPFGNWHVETADQTMQLRVTKRGDAQVHVAARPAAGPSPDTQAVSPASPAGPDAASRAGVSSAASAAAPHDRVAAHLIAPDDPLFDVIGGNAAKRRQVDAFLRALAATVRADERSEPLRVVDLGCGNAYLTFAAYRYLSGIGVPATVTGVDVRADQRERNTALAERLGWAGSVRFAEGTIAAAPVEAADLVLALHACDTATDEALARAVRWNARWILAAPCCHHDIAAQLRQASAPAGYEPLIRHAILRERFADVLTDALRADLLRLHGYRVEVVEFIDSAHTPRNALIRAVRTGTPPTPAQRREYAELTTAWQITPHLETLLGGSAGT